MIFYLCQTAEGRKLAPTQADAKALDRTYKQIDVPTDKASLMAFVNGLYAEADSKPAPEPTIDLKVPEPTTAEIKAHAAKPVPASECPPGTNTLKPKAAPENIEAVEEIILKSTGSDFGRLLTCSVARLGELGRRGWEAFQNQRTFTGDPEGSKAGARKRHEQFIPGSDERGLRYLALAMVSDLNGELPEQTPLPAPRVRTRAPSGDTPRALPSPVQSQPNDKLQAEKAREA